VEEQYGGEDSDVLGNEQRYKYAKHSNAYMLVRASHSRRPSFPKQFNLGDERRVVSTGEVTNLSRPVPSRLFRSLVLDTVATPLDWLGKFTRGPQCTPRGHPLGP
jgi:hypothetical protein